MAPPLDIPLAVGTRRPDQREFIARAHPQLDKALQHSLTEDQIEALSARREDLKYFYIRLSAGQADALTNAVARVWGQLNEALAHVPGACPSRRELYGLANGEAYSLFGVARIDAVLRSDEARTIGDFGVFRDAGLDHGLPKASVVPSLNLFDRELLDSKLKTLGITRPQVAKNLQGSFRNGRSPQDMTDFLCRGKAGERGKRTMRFRISRRLAEAYLRAIEKAAGASVRLILEEVFPSDPIACKFGYKLGTVPLGRADGNWID